MLDDDFLDRCALLPPEPTEPTARVLHGIAYEPPAYGEVLAAVVLVDTDGREVRGDYLGCLLVPAGAP